MTDDTTSVPVTIEQQDDGTIRLVNQHVVDELRAENERLKSTLEELNHTLGMHDFSAAELAAAKAREARTWQDVNELRERISKRRFELAAGQDYYGAAGVRGILDMLNEFETFREAT